jgi:hypothetical protein
LRDGGKSAGTKAALELVINESVGLTVVTFRFLILRQWLRESHFPLLEHTLLARF